MSELETQCMIQHSEDGRAENKARWGKPGAVESTAGANKVVGVLVDGELLLFLLNGEPMTVMGGPDIRVVLSGESVAAVLELARLANVVEPNWSVVVRVMVDGQADFAMESAFRSAASDTAVPATTHAPCRAVMKELGSMEFWHLILEHITTSGRKFPFEIRQMPTNDDVSAGKQKAELRID
ncbi:MAG: hypothetical protein M1829_005812 [Trizodia sp. TS-e1964]|nr:MAG: hypothetical protein M1829_005812 [Trizodia sp. TS-e1964]